MNYFAWLSKLLNTRTSSEEAHKIKNSITVETLRTSVKLDQTNRVIDYNITITHSLAKAMGVLR